MPDLVRRQAERALAAYWNHRVPTSVRDQVRLEFENGAGDGLRTRYLNLGKVALYQLSYSRIRKAEDKMVPKAAEMERVTGIEPV